MVTLNNDKDLPLLLAPDDHHLAAENTE
jgi:hypothetical protein